MSNDLILPLVLIAASLLLLAVVVTTVVRRSKRQRTAELREQFGPEYERALEQHGSQARAERELLARERRREELDIRLLSVEQCERFSAEWMRVQQRFVDDPSGAVGEADGLVKDVMRARGYPVGTFEQRVADLSVEHADVIEHYRAARTLAAANEDGRAETEDLRQAMVHYRALFSDLLQAQRAPQPVAAREAETVHHTQRLSHT